MSHSEYLQAKLNAHDRCRTLKTPSHLPVMGLKDRSAGVMAKNGQFAMVDTFFLPRAALETQPKGGISPNFSTYNMFNFPVF